MSGLGQQEGDAGAGRIDRIRVGVAPVLVGHVAGDPGDLRVGHRRGDFSLRSETLVVHGGDHSVFVDLAHASHRLVRIGAVVAREHLDARTVGATTGIERIAGRLERQRLVFERNHGGLEDGHESDLELLGFDSSQAPSSQSPIES